MTFSPLDMDPTPITQETLVSTLTEGRDENSLTISLDTSEGPAIFQTGDGLKKTSAEQSYLVRQIHFCDVKTSILCQVSFFVYE